MRQFETVDAYIAEALNAGDRVAFAGYGIVDGLKVSSKRDTYKVVGVSKDGDLNLKAYRGRRALYLGASMYDQKMQVLSKEEFNNLK